MEQRAGGLEDRIGYHFQNGSLIKQALTHRSTSGEHMERMEFLGDAVLGMVIAARLYEQFPHTDEGELTRMRAAMVCKDGLLMIAHKWRLATYLHVGGGERDRDEQLKSASIVANAVEAVIGAVFLDGGWERARAFVLKAWADSLHDVDRVDNRDAKTHLQEFTQAHGLGLPEYVVRDLGADCNPRFEAECHVNGKKAGEGAGERKKTAEMAAALQVWHHLRDKSLG
ncbi:MAG: ribonuclease III [Mariprofundaceae bacterium]|nr:ribonuclease III [Mariprofundaceae bacterium]